MLVLRCVSCGSEIAAPESVPGGTVGCPKCGQTLTLPAPSTNAETVVTPRVDPSQTLTAGSDSVEGPSGPIRIPGYEVLEELGRGGMGVVYKARQFNPPRFVALKMVLAGEHADPDQLARFRTEAEATARLNHPAIVQIHHVGEWRADSGESLPFLTLEYVDGEPLSKAVKRLGKVPPQSAADLVRRLARGVHYAHQRGIVHRDLKPSNVLLAGAAEADALGEPKIVDFGIAKPLEGFATIAGEGPQTHTGAVLGTPSYMSPEQARGAKNVGPAADIYSLGAILYELLTGRPPFIGESTVETLLRVTREDPAAPRSLCGTIPRDLETICLTCLAKSPERRYASAGHLADDLGRFLAGESVKVRAPSAMERLGRWSKNRKGLLYVCVGGATAAVVAGIIFLVTLLQPPSPVPHTPAPTGANIDEARARIEDARNQMVVQNNLKQVAVAFHNYASANLDKWPLAAWNTKLDNKQYRVKAGDTLEISGTNVFENAPINGTYPIRADGTIELGAAYGGSVSVTGLTLDEVRPKLQTKVREFAKAAVIAAYFARSSLLSWRVAMLPYLEEDNLFREFKQDEAWDSEHNKKLIGRMPKVYAPVGFNADPGMTYIKVFVGDGIFGRMSNRFTIGNIPDGTSNTILAAEGGDPVVWTKPDDFEFDSKKPVPKIALPGKNGFNVALADGSVRNIPAQISERSLKDAIQPDDGNIIGSDFYGPMENEPKSFQPVGTFKRGTFATAPRGTAR